MPAHLRCGHTYPQLTAGFGVGVAMVYRYGAEAVEILAALAPDRAAATRTAARKAFVVLAGTLLPIDRIAADRPYCPGKHRKHGMNVQVLAAPPPAFSREVPPGRLLRASPALPDAVHDVRAARTCGVIDALVDAGKPVRVVGFDGTPDGRKAVGEGTLYASAAQQPAARPERPYGEPWRTSPRTTTTC